MKKANFVYVTYIRKPILKVICLYRFFPCGSRFCYDMQYLLSWKIQVNAHITMTDSLL